MVWRLKIRNDRNSNRESMQPGSEPIEPERGKTGGISWVKGALFLMVIIYFALSYYSTPLLTVAGKTLVVEHPQVKSDLIVCLSGRNIERGLAAADIYLQGYAPRIYAGRERRPDGTSLLRERGISYPETVDLLKGMVVQLGVPESAVIVGDEPVNGTFEEAESVRDLVRTRGYRSLILVTSPTHTRRAWLTFRKVLDDDNVRISVIPTPYSDFNPGNWWKDKKYLREVINEYQKLMYYYFRYLM